MNQEMWAEVSSLKSEGKIIKAHSAPMHLVMTQFETHGPWGHLFKELSDESQSRQTSYISLFHGQGP
jgi:hypothetical protein